MKKIRKGLCLFLAVALLVSFIPCIPVSAAPTKLYLSGSGTKEDPYIIDSSYDLNCFESWVNSGGNTSYVYVELANDIVVWDKEFNDVSYDEYWTPIGFLDYYDRGYSFYGSFDGKGHTISGIFVSLSEESIGLFGEIKNSEIKNLTLKNSHIGDACEDPGLFELREWCGGIVYRAENSRIENCHIVDSVVQGTSAGGIVNNASNCVIVNCSSSARVYGARRVGGIVGSTSDCQIINCRNNGIVSGVFAGGIVGKAVGDIEITGSYNSGSVDGQLYAGGIVGWAEGAYKAESTLDISQCYNTGKIGTAGFGIIDGRELVELGLTTDIDYPMWGEALHDFNVCSSIVARSDVSNGKISNCFGTSDKYKILGYIGEGKTVLENCAVGVKTHARQDGSAVEITYVPISNDGDNFIAVFESGERVKTAKVVQNRARISDLKYGVEYTFTPISKVDGEYKLLDFASIKLTLVAFASSGDGTESSPYIIETADQLIAFKDWVNAGKNTEYVYVKLAKDIDLERDDKDTYWIDGYCWWEGIGKYHHFYGCFDGDGHTVSKIYAASGDERVGFFYSVKNSTIKNLGVKDSRMGNAQGEPNSALADYSAAIVYSAYNSRIENCYNATKVEGCNSAGIVYSAQDSVIIDCYNVGIVSADQLLAGIVYSAYNCQIINCYNSGPLYANWDVVQCGGIVYDAEDTEIINCYNTSDLVDADNFNTLGGIASKAWDCVIDGCYNTGKISGDGYCGGIVGDATRTTIRNSYSLSGDPLVGNGDPTIENSFVVENYQKTTAIQDGEIVEVMYNPAVSEGDNFIAVFENGEKIKTATVTKNVARINGLKYGVEYTFTPISKVKGEYKYIDYASIKYTPKNNVLVNGPKAVLKSATETSLSFSWNEIEGAQLYYVTVMGNGYKKCFKATGEELTVKGLKSESVYTVSIKASLGDGKYSEQGGFVSMETAASKQVETPVAVFKEATKDSISMSWKALDGAELYYVTVEGEGYKKCYTTKQTELIAKSLKPGREYSVSIVAKLGVGKYSTRSAAVAMTTEQAEIAFFATKSGNNLQLIWDEIEGADKYWIKRVDSNGSLTQVKVVENTNTCRLTSVKAGEQQYVLIARVLENGKYYYTNYIYSNKVTI